MYDFIFCELGYKNDNIYIYIYQIYFGLIGIYFYDNMSLGLRKLERVGVMV